MSQKLCFSTLWGRKDATIRPYVTFLLWGTALRSRNRIVVVPFPILITTPFANRPNSLEKELSHSILSSPRLKCLNSSEAPVFGSMTGCARYEFIVEYLDFKYWRT